MKKYTFQINEKEAEELFYRDIWEKMRLNRFYWRLLPLTLILIWTEFAVLRWIMSIFVDLFLLGLLALYVKVNCSGMKNELCGRTRTMAVEDGALKLEIEGELYSERSCADIAIVRTTRRLLMLGCTRTPKTVSWNLIPLRMFADEQEKDAFVEAVRNPANRFEEAEENPTPRSETLSGEAFLSEEAEEIYFHFSIRLEEEARIKIMAEEAEIVRWVILKGKSVLPTGLALSAAAFVPFCILWLVLQRVTGESVVNILPLVGMLLLWSLLRYKWVNPEENIRRRFRKGKIVGSVPKECEMWFAEQGIVCADFEAWKVVTPWENLRCAVEADGNLFFFVKNNGFLALPREALGGGELERVKGLCREKDVKLLEKERKTYAPGWVFTLLLAVLVIGYGAICVGYFLGAGGRSGF